MYYRVRGFIKSVSNSRPLELLGSFFWSLDGILRVLEKHSDPVKNMDMNICALMLANNSIFEVTELNPIQAWWSNYLYSINESIRDLEK